ncbi:MAG: hypothetical protein Q9213_005570 [Squamulea squamosa]
MTTSLQGPDLSPYIYHIPKTRNTLLIRLHDDPLPINAFGFTIREARILIADVLATHGYRSGDRLPQDKDPSEYPKPGSLAPVSITWQSRQGSFLTWGILAAALKGLEDCLVMNDRLPWVVTWYIFDGPQGGEVGWGTVARGKGHTRSIATA